MTESDAVKVKEELIANDAEFRRLFEEHQDCERELDALHRKSLLSEEDEFAEKRLKRHKLTLKDQMFAMMREHREARVSA